MRSVLDAPKSRITPYRSIENLSPARDSQTPHRGQLSTWRIHFFKAGSSVAAGSAQAVDDPQLRRKIDRGIGRTLTIRAYPYGVDGHESCPINWLKLGDFWAAFLAPR